MILIIKRRFKPNGNTRPNYNINTHRNYNDSRKDMRKTAINNARMENIQRITGTNRQNMNSPIRTPRRTQRHKHNSNGFFPDMNMIQPYPWNNHQMFIYPTNQKPNFFIPFHQPNPIIIQQATQQAPQNTQQNQT